MRIGLDGNAVFNDYLEYKANDIIAAFEGNNPSVSHFDMAYIWHRGLRKDKHQVLVDGLENNALNRTGLYIFHREDEFDAKRSFVYCGVTAKVGFIQRFVKVCRHALNNISNGDSVIPLSHYLRTVCKGDLEGIRACFIPMAVSHDELKDLERIVIKKLRESYGWKVRNVSNGEKAPVEAGEPEYVELPI